MALIEIGFLNKKFLAALNYNNSLNIQNSFNEATLKVNKFSKKNV